MAIERPAADISALEQVPVHLLPGETVKFLMPSRFCQSDQFEPFVMAEFGSLSGGPRVAAMRDWIEANIAYVHGTSNPRTTVVDTFVQRQGICRDFAHLMVTLARASQIPARIVASAAHGARRTRFPSVARAAKTHMTARQGEPDSNLHPKREQRCALSVDLWGRRVRCYANSPRLASLAGSRSPAANRRPKRSAALCGSGALPLLSQLAPSGVATGSRSPAEISALELVDAEHRPLLLPEQRQLAGPLQSLGGEGDRLGAVEDRLDQVRSQEGELQRRARRRRHARPHDGRWR